jgi:LmbE family N-acetylglucosaminyl deacetylase
MRKVAMAVAAHPDDIEFLMAGTLLRLRSSGYEIHYMNLSSGNCGSTVYDAAETSRVRLEEARRSASVLGAEFHAPISNDFEIVYDVTHLRKLASVIRQVSPNILLTHSPSDYMEDHMNTSRLVVTAAFVRGVRNFQTEHAASDNYNCVVYHALPHGLVDPLRRKVYPEFYIDTSEVHQTKYEALKAHASQQEWLEDSQKMNSYLLAMDSFSRQVGGMSGVYEHAEGWRRHSHLGFSEAGYDPLQELGSYVNESYWQQA